MDKGLDESIFEHYTKHVKKIKYTLLLGEAPIWKYAAAQKHREMPMGQQV